MAGSMIRRRLIERKSRGARIEGFSLPRSSYGRSQAESFRDVFELAERADSWGIDCV